MAVVDRMVQTRIQKKWAELRSLGGKAFVPYIMCGDPDLGVTAAVLRELAEAGSDFIELGIPFSDPVGDGRVIQEAGQRSLKAGTRLKNVFETAKAFRKTHDTPLLLMTYYNPVFRYGLERFADSSVEAGIDGFIIPDLAPEEAGEFRQICESRNLHLIYLLAPTSDRARMQLIAGQGSGFLYYISRTGVTGMAEGLSDDLEENLKALRANGGLPVVVGFGISNLEQARQVAPLADGVVVGSAIVNLIQESGAAAAGRVRDFVRPIIQNLHHADPAGR